MLIFVLMKTLHVLTLVIIKVITGNNSLAMNMNYLKKLDTDIIQMYMKEE